MSRFSNLPHVQGEQLSLTQGTPVQGSNVQVPAGIKVIVLAHADNTGRVTVASSSAAALNTATTNLPLEAGQSVSLLVRNFNNLYCDSTVTGDKVRLFCEKE